MHPHHPGMHIAIDSSLLILSFELKFYVCWYVSIISGGFRIRFCFSVRPSVCLSERNPRKEITLYYSQFETDGRAELNSNAPMPSVEHGKAFHNENDNSLKNSFLIRDVLYLVAHHYNILVHEK